MTAAVEAFTQGWAQATAQHPVPLTERARTACHAACAVAEASPEGALAPTLKLGQLEGIWAVIYARREAIEKMHSAALADILDAISRLDWQAIIDQAGRYVTSAPGMDGKALAGLLARDINTLIGSSLTPTELGDWRAAMQAALLDATAEGQAAGMALVGLNGGIQIDFNIAATAAQQALANDQVLWSQSSAWMTKQTEGIAYDVSRTIASMWADEASHTDMTSAVADLLDVGRSSAARVLDTAVGQALSVGALTSYQLAGVAYADFITAGDGRVCPACGQAEDDNSYPLAECPQPPLHPGCRCCLAPSAYTPNGNVISMLDPYVLDTSEEDMAA